MNTQTFTSSFALDQDFWSVNLNPFGASPAQARDDADRPAETETPADLPGASPSEAEPDFAARDDAADRLHDDADAPIVAEFAPGRVSVSDVDIAFTGKPAVSFHQAPAHGGGHHGPAAPIHGGDHHPSQDRPECDDDAGTPDDGAADDVSFAGAFNFAFIRFDQTEVEAANISADQNDTGNSNTSVTLTLDGATLGFELNTALSNRGDYHITLNDDYTDDSANGVLISSIATNGVDHGQGQGLQYGTVATADGGAGRIYISLFDAPSGAEYNSDVSSAYFTYDKFTAGWAFNSVNGGPITELRSSDNIVLGENFTQLDSGVFRLDLDGVNTIEDGVLLVVGGKNEDNYALSRPLDDGTGFLIETTDNGKDGGDYEQDPVSFVFLEEGKTDLTFGRVLSDGSSSAGQGDYHIEKLGEGRYRLTIDGVSPADGALVVSGEGVDLLNQDNIVSYQADGDGWIIETRDAVSGLLQDAGERVYATEYDHIVLPEIDAAYIGTAAESIAIWQDASVDYAFVMGHRGGIFEANEIVEAEYSSGMVDYAVSMGMNMIEIDVRTTADGEFVIMHDATIDRTTNGSGAVADMTLAELKAVNLVNEGTGEVLDEGVLTLDELLDTAKDQVMISIDVKPGLQDFAAVMAVVEAHDMVDHVVLQYGGLSTYEELNALADLLAEMPKGTDIIPSIMDSAVSDIDFVRAIFETLRPNGLMINVAIDENDLTQDGGPLFSDEMRALAEEYDVRLTVNTLNSGYEHQGINNGLRNDHLALNDPDAGWGFWIDQGAGAFLTDEALLAIDYFNESGDRLAFHKNEVVGTEQNDRLIGTDGADALQSLGGRVDRMTGGDGADTFVFGAETTNGLREKDILIDYTVGEDVIDLGGTKVVRVQQTGMGLQLHLNGDGDVIVLQAVQCYDDLLFA